MVQTPPPTGPMAERAVEEKISPTIDPQAVTKPAAVILDAFPELQELPPEKFLLDEIFTTSAEGSLPTHLNHLLTKLLVATAPLLSEKILQKDELVHRIASGIAYFPFEIPYANGLLTWPMNYYALICTNHRLIFINLDYRLSRPERYIFQIPYDNIVRVSRGFYGSSLITTTVAGHRWNFTTVNRRLASSLEKFIREKSGPLAAGGTETLAASQLCPACYQPVQKKIASCPHCLIPYKATGTAIKKSLFLPGTGNIYLSNQYLGIIEILGYLFTWMMTIVLVIIGIPGGILGGGLLIISYHCMAAFMVGRMAEKGNLVVNKCPDAIFPSSGAIHRFIKKPW